MTSRAACATTIVSTCTISPSSRQGAANGSRPTRIGGTVGRRHSAGKRRRHFGHPLHVRHDRPVEGCHDQGRACRQGCQRHGCLRQVDRQWTVCLPTCRWPGSAITISTSHRAMFPGLCMACPESPQTVAHDLREIGPTFYFAPPRIFEGLLTSVTIRMEDAGWLKRWIFDHHIAVAKKYGEAILEGRRGAFARQAALRDRQSSRLRAAEECAGPVEDQGCVYCGRGDRGGSVFVLPFARASISSNSTARPKHSST